MSFMQAVTAVLTNYAGFSGRARRSEFWFFVLFQVLLSIVLNIIGAVIHTAVLSYLASLALIIPGLAVTVRRLHDTNRSGWWVLIGLVPVVGAIVLIVFCATAGQAGANQHGPDPKAAAPSAPAAA